MGNGLSQTGQAFLLVTGAGLCTALGACTYRVHTTRTIDVPLLLLFCFDCKETISSFLLLSKFSVSSFLSFLPSFITITQIIFTSYHYTTAAVVFFPSLANLAKPHVLAISLAFASGIMVYISLVDIYTKAIVGYVQINGTTFLNNNNIIHNYHTHDQPIPRPVPVRRPSILFCPIIMLDYNRKNKPIDSKMRDMMREKVSFMRRYHSLLGV